MNTYLTIYGIGAIVSFGVLFVFLKQNESMYYEQDNAEMDLPFGDDNDKPKKVNKRNILFTIIGAVLWPLTLLIVIVIGIHSIVKKRKAHKKEVEAKKKEQQRLNAFNKSIPSDNSTDITKCVELWRNIVALTEAEQYNKLTESLSEISVADGYTLNISLCKTPKNDEYFIGDDSYLYVAGKDGKQEKDIFKYINVTNSYKGAWQAFVLHELWRFLPHFWHGGYNNRTFVFDKQDLQKVVDSVNKNPHTKNVSIDVAKFDVRPQITKNGNNYFVSYCYWNDWEGLVREVVGITIIDCKVTEIHNLSNVVGYQYDCGIRY